MNFIDTRTGWLGWPGMLHGVGGLGRRVPELLTVCGAFIVLLVLGWLDYIAGPGGDSVFTIHKDFYLESE